MGVSERREIIRQILENGEIAGQDELLEKLLGRGIGVTQSSVSRDLRAMRVAKVSGRYRTTSSFNPDASAFQALAGAVKNACCAGPNLLVVRTPPGQAPAVALAIDSADWPEVVGTVAGDDTLFIATRDRGDQRVIEARLSCLVESK